ncbi:MAG: branched-chain amino acid ABC transporter permease [Epsilonproteobacteria bacterium]|nr:branched-chain amino acid ABC transporter permease [Campylobacterota bacterium]
MSKYFIRLALISAAVMILLYISMQYLDSYTVMILENLGIFIILAVSYNLINGVTGQFSLEPNGFVAIGAYVTALLLLDKNAKLDQFMLSDPSDFILAIHSSFVPALLISGIVASLVAFMLAFAVFRVRGDYLAIVTLGFGFIIRIFAVNQSEYTNGSMGLSGISNEANLMWIGVFVLISITVVLNIVYSKFGRAMKAIRDDEDAAEAIGVDVFKIKTYAFMTSAFFEGVGGGLMASLLTTISPEQFSFMLTFELLIIIVLGGLGSISGSILGTIIVIAGMEWLRFLDEPNFFSDTAHPGLRMVVFSVILILIMLFARKGILGNKELWDIVKVKK